MTDLVKRATTGASVLTTAEYRAGAKSLYDCFHEVNGQNLFEALLDLCAVAREHGRPITFM